MGALLEQGARLLQVALFVSTLVTAGCGSRNGGSPEEEESAVELIEFKLPKRTNAEQRPQGLLPEFRIVGQEAGFDFQRYDDIRGARRILEVNGGGIALFDFDRDSRLDVFMTNGCRLPRESGDQDSPSELFWNAGQMSFQKSAAKALLDQFGYSHGCAAGDYDGDGFDDLYITALGPNTFWRNNGDGTFCNVTEDSGTAVPLWSSSAAFADLNGDGHLDLYVVNYLDESESTPKLCPNPQSPDGYEQCSPAIYEGVDDVLFISDGGGTFRDASAEAGIAGSLGKGLGVVVSNLDQTGLPEIYVANDGEANFLFVANPESDEVSFTDSLQGPKVPRYQENALSASVALNELGHAQASMGIAAGDYDRNGTVDLFLTHFFGDTNTLYSNTGSLLFTDMTRASNLGATSRNFLGFGTAFLDADNDGWFDLIVANGHVDDRTWMSGLEPYRMRPQMYRNQRDGQFIETSNWSGDYFQQEWLGRGLAIGDLDHDGRVDAVVSHQLAPSVVLQNRTLTSHGSIILDLVGRVSNRNGFNTRVEVTNTDIPLMQELVGGGSFQSASANEISLGIGNASTSSLRITWPSGVTDDYTSISPGRWVAIEGQALRRASDSASDQLQSSFRPL